MKDVCFDGALLARRTLFSPGQCVILKSANLHESILPEMYEFRPGGRVLAGLNIWPKQDVALAPLWGDPGTTAEHLRRILPGSVEILEEPLVAAP